MYSQTAEYEEAILDALKKFNRRVSHEEFMASPEIDEIYSTSTSLFDQAMRMLALRGRVSVLSVNSHVSYTLSK